MYGQPFRLTFKGQNFLIKYLNNLQFRTFKTKIGAFVTAIILMSVISFLVYKLNILFGRSDNKTSRFVINEASLDNPEMIDVNKLGFDIAFGGYEDIDPKYGSVKVSKFTKVRQFNKTTGQFDEDVEIVKCGYENFNYPRKNESAYQDVSILFCIKDKSFLRLGGAWTTNRLEQINICLQPCENTTTSKNCASKKQQDEFFSMVDFQLRFVNQYFDFADMNNPVKSFIEDRYFIPVIPDQQKGMDIFIKKAQGKLNDNFIPFVPQQDLKFALVENFKMYTARLDYYGKCFAKFSLRMDLESDLYTRQVYTFSDMLSDLGGIYSSLFALGAILTNNYKNNIGLKTKKYIPQVCS
eukprot:403348109